MRVRPAFFGVLYGLHQTRIPLQFSHTVVITECLRHQHHHVRAALQSGLHVSERRLDVDELRARVHHAQSRRALVLATPQ